MPRILPQRTDEESDHEVAHSPVAVTARFCLRHAGIGPRGRRRGRPGLQRHGQQRQDADALAIQGQDRGARVEQSGMSVRAQALQQRQHAEAAGRCGRRRRRLAHDQLRRERQAGPPGRRRRECIRRPIPRDADCLSARSRWQGGQTLRRAHDATHVCDRRVGHAALRGRHRFDREHRQEDLAKATARASGTGRAQSRQSGEHKTSQPYGCASKYES